MFSCISKRFTCIRPPTVLVALTKRLFLHSPQKFPSAKKTVKARVRESSTLLLFTFYREHWLKMWAYCVFAQVWHRVGLAWLLMEYLALGICFLLWFVLLLVRSVHRVLGIGIALCQFLESRLRASIQGIGAWFDAL